MLGTDSLVSFVFTKKSEIFGLFGNVVHGMGCRLFSSFQRHQICISELLNQFLCIKAKSIRFLLYFFHFWIFKWELTCNCQYFSAQFHTQFFDLLKNKSKYFFFFSGMHCMEIGCRLFFPLFMRFDLSCRARKRGL